jgi:hypothetical protein
MSTQFLGLSVKDRKLAFMDICGYICGYADHP